MIPPFSPYPIHEILRNTPHSKTIIDIPFPDPVATCARLLDVRLQLYWIYVVVELCGRLTSVCGRLAASFVLLHTPTQSCSVLTRCRVLSRVLCVRPSTLDTRDSVSSGRGGARGEEGCG